LIRRKLVQMNRQKRPALLHGNDFGNGALATTLGSVQEDNGALIGVPDTDFLEFFEERGGQLEIAKGTRRITDRRKRPQTLVDAPLFEKVVDNAMLRAKRAGQETRFAIGRV
jgi:hypothetical protein